MTYRGLLFVLSISVACLFATSSAYAACISVTRTLSIGSSGKEVLTLQRFLNSDTSTQIAILGKDSPGEETGVFNAATSRAVKALQIKNRATILTPAGLTQPNGVVGKFTRDVIKQQLCGIASNNKFFIATTTTARSIPSVEALANQKKLADLTAHAQAIIKESSQKVDAKIAVLDAKTAALQTKIDKIDKNLADQEAAQHLMDILSSGNTTLLAPAATGDFGKADPLTLVLFSMGNVHRGERIAIAGTGFLAKNIVHFGGQVLDSGTPNASGTVLYITIPSGAVNGKTEVVIENAKGKSNAKYLLVVDGDVPPHISAMSPKNPSIGAMVTILGDHFAQNNDIVTTYGPIRNVVSSDGKTLNFRLNPEMLSLFGSVGSSNIPFSIGVSNASGVSNTLTISLR